MLAAVDRFRAGSVTRSRNRLTERTKKSSPSGNTPERDAARWLRMRLPSWAK
jgi:hypothetical protein